MSTVGQVIADPDFAKLSPQDQQGVLTHFDPGFGKISPTELPAVVEGIRNKGVPADQQPENSSSLSAQGKAIASGQAPPQVTPKMQPQDPTLSDYGSILGQTALMTVGAGPEGAALPKVAEAAASEIPAAGAKAKAAYPILKNFFQAFGSGEMAGAQAEASAFKDVMDSAYEAAAEARQAGNHASAAMFETGALVAKAATKLNSAIVYSGKATRGIFPMFIGFQSYYNFIKDVYEGGKAGAEAVAGEGTEQK